MRSSTSTMNGHKDTKFTTTIPSKSERLNSPNTSKWQPDVRMMMSTNQWLKVHGLKKRKLDMAQLLPSIGFRHSDDYVQPLQKPVRARYCKGLFTQVPYRNGSVYNVIASKEKLKTIEEQLHQVINLYKNRLEWLTTESRRVFGVIEERCISIVLDVDVASDTQFDTYRHALIQVLKEQVMFIAKLNLLRCAADIDKWQEHAICVTLDSMEDALNWIWKLQKVVPRTTTCTVEAITKAISDQHVEAVYLFTEGTASEGSFELLKRKIQGSRVPLHVVAFNCNSPSTITYFKEITKDTNGRFHAFSVSDEYNDTLANFQRMDDDHVDSSTTNGRGRGDGMPSLKLGIGVREDVINLWQELDEARNTLAEIQALQIEISDPKTTSISTAQPPKDMRSETTRTKTSAKSELYMSSREWLKRHGLKNRKLGFYDLLQTLAFKHCDGVVDIQRPPDDFGTEAIVRPKLINARYCDKFAHVRWKDGTIMHVHVSGPVHRNYEQRMLSALDSYRKRIEWLQQGSRELFGTIIEDQVTILIDTSASMASRLFLVKDKLYRLMQEQLRHKVKFNLMKFDSKVQAWRDRLVDCNTHNLDNAWQWVKGLSTGGSTNTLAALKQALSDPQCRAIYILTDGRPDQPPSSIHAQVHLLDPVPIHTISFNCADSEANEFLCQLSSATGARFHYFSEDGYDIHGPKPFESEDLRFLREEIEKGLTDLKKIAMLRNECAQLDWYGSNTGHCSKSHSRSVTGPKRPTSAKGRMVPSPPTSLRPSSARVRPASARSLPPSTTSITHSSFKDYVVTTATKDIPAHKARSKGFHVSETRSSQLRLNLRKQATNDWMLSETKEYLTRKPEDIKKTKTRGRTRKRKPVSTKEDDDIGDVSVRQWLKEYGLVARKLTILDALSPTLIPHTTKYVPILDKHILSKVFDQVLPLAHTSGSNRDEVQLVNPQGVNLKAYESKLEDAIKLYTGKLDELVYFGLSDQERIKYPEDRVPSFSANRESMLEDLEQQGWQVSMEDILMLEKEIEQANTFLVQSQDLRKASEQAAREIAEEQKKARIEMENKRIEQIMSKSASRTTVPTQPTPQGNKYRLRHHKVVARNEIDGFYYPGLVRKCINSRYVEVEFDGFERQAVGVRYVIPIEGARPCPSLKVGDYVLVRTPIPREETDDLIMDGGYAYVPGIVQVVPLRKATASKCYTILRYNGKKTTSLRKDLIKISKARYTFACRYIRDALISAYKASCPFGLYPKGVEEGKELIAVNTGKSKPEKPRSRSSSSSSSSGSSIDHSDENNADSSPNRGRSRNSSKSRSRSSSESKSPDRPHSRSRSRSRSTSRSQSDSHSSSASESEQESEPPSPKSPKSPDKRRSRSPTDHFEDLKKELDEKHVTQLNEIREQREKLEQLQKQLAEEQKKQREQQQQLEQKQKDLQDQQDKLIQAQIEEHKERQNRLQDEQKRLQEQQEDLLKKQKDQQEQLLMQQYNQNQALQLQQQQLMQMLASGQQPKKDQAVETDNGPRSRDNSPVTSPKRTPRHSTRSSPQRSPSSSPKSSKRNSKGSTPRSSRPSSGKKSSRKPSVSGDQVHESASDTDSSSSSDSEVSSRPSTNKNDEVDAPNGQEPAAAEEEGPPNIQVHLSDNNEACLLTKGSHGLLISRLPPDKDPAVETRHVPKEIHEGDEVLARWADEGWYYRGTVRQDCGDGTFFIEDSVGDLEQIPRMDIITDEDDADNVIKEGDPVVGLHPNFSYSYAPGVVISLEDNNMHQVRYYDGIEAMVPREELYLLPAEKFETDCAYILACEESLVGQAVVARNDTDGTFHLGTVRERVGNGRQYIIEWADQSVQLQSTGFIFGAHTKRHPLSIGDRVLALADPATYMYVPGWITGSNGRRLVVKFCNGKSSSHVDPLQCFWLSRDYYDRVVEFYKKLNKDEK